MKTAELIERLIDSSGQLDGLCEEAADMLKADGERIAELETRLSGQNCFVPPEFQNALDAAQAKLAAMTKYADKRNAAALDLQEQLAVSQAREQQLRGALEEMRYSHTDKAERMYQAAIAIPTTPRR